MKIKTIVTITLLFMLFMEASWGSARIKSNSVDAIFEPGKKIILSVTPPDPRAESNVSLLIKDFWGSTVVKQQLLWEKGRNKLEVPVNINTQGYFEAMIISGKSIKYKYPFVIIPLPAFLDNQDNPFGVNFHLPRIGLKEAKREMAIAKRIGIGWGRGMLFDIGHFRKKIDFSSPDCFARWRNLVDVVKGSGLSCVGGIYYVPDWISGAPAGSKYIVYSRVIPEDLTEIRRYCEAAAKYCSFVKYWEVGNENDATLFWRGRWKNNMSGNDKGIIEDYVDFLKAAAGGFRRGNPDAKILFSGITSAKDDGSAYQPFVATSFRAGAGNVIDVMNIHYSKSINDIRKWTRDINKPIWVTELGGSSATVKGGDDGEIVADTTQAVTQLADGASKVFKYDLRDDGINPDEKEHNFGLVRRDFSPKPAYVAYATTIRMLKNAKFNKALNVTEWSKKGWLRGYEFIDSGRAVNCLWLNSAEHSKIRLRSDAPELTLVDMMGNAKVLKIRNGIVEINVDKLPFFIMGNLKPDSGKVTLPIDRLVGKTLLPLNNANFEQTANSTKIPHWTTGMGLKATKLIKPGYRSQKAVEINVSKTGFENFRGFYQRIGWKKSKPYVHEEEYLKLSLQAMVKCDNIIGRGISLNCEFFDAKGKRLKWAETPYRGGTHNWKLLKIKGTSIPPQTARVGVCLYFAPKTYGKVEIDDIKLYVERWKKGTARK